MYTDSLPPNGSKRYAIEAPRESLASFFFLTDAERIRGLDKAARFALISSYSWLGTIGLYVSVVGSFSYGTLIYMPLYYLLMLSFALSHVLQIYASYLDRKVTSQNCPSCGGKVDLKEVNYCCGKIVRNVPEAWFFLPLSLAFLFLIASYTISEWGFPLLLTNSLWMGSCGSIIGGIHSAESISSDHGAGPLVSALRCDF